MYLRVDNGCGSSTNYAKYALNIGYVIPKNRIILEEVEVGISLKYRSKFINLVNHAMESGDLLIINGINSLGGNFKEVFSSISLIFLKKIRLICLDFSQKEIEGDLKKLFIHFMSLCSDFEDQANLSKKSIMNKAKKHVGRPEILNDKQKKEALDKFKKGHSVSSIAKSFSVTRTVINRLVLKSSDRINVSEQIK